MAEELKKSQIVNDANRYALTIQKSWPTIMNVLKTQRVADITTVNPEKREDTFEKKILKVSVNGRDVSLFKPMDYNHLSDEDRLDFNAVYLESFDGERHLNAPESSPTLHMLAELLEKICGEFLGEKVKNLIARKHGPSSTGLLWVQWLEELLSEKGNMIETFRHFYPNVEGRFTCFNSYTNRRYENEGMHLLPDLSIFTFLCSFILSYIALY